MKKETLAALNLLLQFIQLEEFKKVKKYSDLLWPGGEYVNDNYILYKAILRNDFSCAQSIIENIIFEHSEIEINDSLYHESNSEFNELDDDYNDDDYNDDSNRLSYSKYNGAHGYDDDTIDSAFEGDPDNCWNVD